MKFSRNTLLAAVVTLTSIAAATDVQACRGGRGGGYSGGFSRGYSSSSYSGYSSYRTPSYGYGTPTYAPNYSHVQPIQPVQQIAPQPLMPTQPVQQQLIPQQTPVQQISQQQVAPQQAPQQQVAPQQTQQTQQPVAPRQQVAPQQTQTPGNAQMSALQALGGFAPPQTAATPAPQQQIQTPSHVGNWTATLSNGASVQLTLQADGNFSWVATNKSGAASSFSGRYTIGNGSLTLNRSNDNQQLGGSMTTNGNNAFSFKVAGNNAASLNFSRS